jgi:acetyl esterase
MKLNRRARAALGLTKALTRAGLAPTLERTLRQPAEKRMSTKVPFLLTGPMPKVKREDRVIPYGDGSSVRVRLYFPPSATDPAPTVAYFHGGGWVLGGLPSCDHICARIAAAGALVLSVDYRLAPEHPYPAGLDDCRGGTEWLFAHAGELGGDPARFVVAGDSAGGNLAAAITIACRGSFDQITVAAQVLVYPAVDLTGEGPQSAALEGTGMSAQDLEKSVSLYLGDQDPRDPLVSPLLLDDCSGLPPTLIITAGFDPLHPGGQAFATRLTAAGVAVRYLHYEDYAHGFYSVPTLYSGMKQAWGELTSYITSVAPIPSGPDAP